MHLLRGSLYFMYIFRKKVASSIVSVLKVKKVFLLISLFVILALVDIQRRELFKQIFKSKTGV